MPTETARDCEGCEDAWALDEDDGVAVRKRSPRRIASDCMTVRPPRIMFCVP